MRKRNFNKGVFAMPYTALAIIFVVFPLVLVTIYAFTDSSGSFTLDNVINVFTNSTNLTLLLKTIYIAFLTTVLCFLISYPIALVLSSSDFNKKTILALLFIVPMWMNFVLRMFALDELFSVIGIGNSFTAAIVGLVYDFLPFMLLPIYTVLVNLDKSYLEASRDLGGNELVTFAKVTFPLSIKGIVSGAIMVFMPVFSAYAVTDILGDVNTSLIGGKINDLFEAGLWNSGSALSFVLLVLVFGTMAIANLVMRKRKKS